jgi:hypothetical protein
MNKLNMRGVREERFKGLTYHQRVSIRYERVKASNSCVGSLIFGSFFLLSSVKNFSPSLFAFFFWLSVLLSFLPLSNWFLSSFISPLFLHYFIYISLAHLISSLTYLNLIEIKRLGCCCVEVVLGIGWRCSNAIRDPCSKSRRYTRQRQ